MSQKFSHSIIVGVLVLAVSVLAWLAPAASPDAAFIHARPALAQTCAGFYDDFAATDLDAGWTWINEDRWSLTERPGYLRIYTQQPEVDPTYLLRAPADAIGAIWSHVEVDPAARLQSAGIVVYQDGENWLDLRRFSTSDETFVMLRLQVDGDLQTQSGTSVGELASPVLRIRREGGEWVAEFATVEEAQADRWGLVARVTADFAEPQVGVIASASESDDLPVDVDDFCLDSLGGGTPTATPTSTVASATTPTPTGAPADLTLTGRVYDASAGPDAGIENAAVSLISCYPRTFPTLTDAEGRYEIFVAAQYLTPCPEVIIEVEARGYGPRSLTVAVSSLYAQPERDFGLVPQMYLPLVAKFGSTPQPTPTETPVGPTPTATPTGPPPEPTPPATALELEPITDELDQPVHVTHAGDGSGRLFVVEKAGTIRIVTDGTVNPLPFLDLTPLVGSAGSEQGLLSVAFHPDYETNGYFYVNYTDLDGDTVVARYSVSANPDVADPNSDETILTLDQPAANHNGGLLLFGPDGYLYVGTGDGGSAGDPWGNAQNPDVLFGKMLRLDVDGAEPYTIPPDNPFVDDPMARDEVWALGLRNPWRYSFDRTTNDLWIGDVGQGAWEEVDLQPAGSPGGENYGWDVMEGTHCFEPSVGCDRSGLTLPVVEYGHTGGNCSVTGGYVYRGAAFPSLAGVYFFGDYCSGRIWSLSREGDSDWTMTEVLDTDHQISSFGEDEAGELYLTDLDGGLYRLSAPGD